MVWSKDIKYESFVGHDDVVTKMEVYIDVTTLYRTDRDEDRLQGDLVYLLIFSMFGCSVVLPSPLLPSTPSTCFKTFDLVCLLTID